MKIKTKYKVNDYICYTNESLTSSSNECICRISKIHINIDELGVSIQYTLNNGKVIPEKEILYQLVKK